MIIYGKTYEDVQLKGKNFPVENSFYAKEDKAVISAGTRRDTALQLNQITLEEMIKRYPRPSGAALAAQIVCKTFVSGFPMTESLQSIMVDANNNIKKLNDKYIPNCDYVINDFYSATAVSAALKNNLLTYSYIGDCGIIVYDKEGNIKFQTEDQFDAIQDKINMHGYTWDQPEGRVIIRKNYRNHIPVEKEQPIISYGALTGETVALAFIRTSFLELDPGDLIILYTKGFQNYFRRTDFWNQMISFNPTTFDSYIETVASSDFKNYGQEKTLVIIKN